MKDDTKKAIGMCLMVVVSLYCINFIANDEMVQGMNDKVENIDNCNATEYGFFAVCPRDMMDLLGTMGGERKISMCVPKVVFDNSNLGTKLDESDCVWGLV